MMSKKNPKRTVLMTALAGALILGSGAALAQPGFGGRGGRGGGERGGGPAAKMMRLMERLELSEQQEVQLVRIRRELRKERQDLRTAMFADRKAAFEELKKDAPNAQRLHDMLDRHAKARTALAHKALDRVMAFHATLTPAQKAELQKTLDRFEQRWQKRRARFAE